MANEGVEIDIYSYEDPTVKVGSLFGRRDPKSLEQLKAVGGGSFLISGQDPHYAKKKSLLDSRNVCKIKVDGRVTDAFLINDKLPSYTNDRERNLEYEVSGPGLKMWFDDAEVYPYHTLRPYSSSARYFNFASESGTWYSQYSWTDPVLFDTVLSEGNPWGNNPDKWPGGAEKAKWIWAVPYASQMPYPGVCYFRYTITLAQAGQYAIYTAVDNQYELYVDGEFIAKSSERSSSHYEASRVQLQLGAGTHVIGYKAWNFTPPQEGPINPSALLMSIFKVSPAGKETRVGQSGDPGWKCLAYPTNVPGWTIGEVLLSLINEAETRGIRSMGWLNPTFTATHDSNGVAWAERREWAWGVGTSYAQVITELEDLYDIWIDPDTYQLNVAPERGIDRSVPIGNTPPVRFVMGKHLKQLRVQTRGKIKNSLLIKTDDGWVEKSAGPTSINKYGRIEGSMEVGGPGSNASAVASVVFKQRALTEEGASYDLVMDKWIPKLHFNVGDWVLAPNADLQLVKRRIMSISVGEGDAGNPVWTIEFDTIFEDSQSKLTRMVAKLGGAGVGGSTGGGTGIRPGNNSVITFPPSTPDVNQQDTVPPPAPSKPILSTRLGVVSVKWNGRDLDGLRMPPDVDMIEVMQGPAPGIAVGSLRASAGEDIYHVTGLTYNTLTDFWLVAVDLAGNRSADSEVASIATKALVDTDIIGRVIDGVNLKLETITAELIEAGAILQDKLADNAVSLAKLDSITRDKIENASADATTANGRVTTSLSAPTAANGTGKPTGALWFRYNASGTLLGTWRWNGTAWEAQSWGTDAIAAGAIVTEKLANSAVDSTKLATAVNNAISQASTDATTALTAANGKNRITYSTSPASGTSSGGYNFIEGDTWFQRVGGIVTGQWQFTAGAWQQRTLDNAVIANLDAGKITAGFLDAARINSRTITAEKLVLGNFENLIPNGSFVQGMLGWSNSAPSEAVTVTDGPTGASTPVIRISPSSTDQGVNSTQYPFSGGMTAYTPGATYAFRFVVRKVSGTAGSIRIRLGFHGTGQTNSWIVVPGTDLQASSATAGQWVTLTGVYTTPTASPRDKMSVSIHVNGTTTSVFEVSEVSMRVMADAELIVDGSITGTKIAANSVTSVHMVAGTITAASGIIANAAIGTAQIADLAVTSGKIAALDAGKITTGTLDAARIGTNTLTARMIAIGDYTNYAAGSDFENNDTNPWSMPSGFQIITTGTKTQGAKVLQINSVGNGSSAALNTIIPCKPGDVFYAEFWMWRSSDWNGQAGNSKLRFGFSGGGLAALGYAVGDAPSQVWTKRSFQFTVPAGDHVHMAVTLANSDATTGRVYLDDIVIRRVFDGELLVDGAITTRTIAANAVTTNEIATRTILATDIATNAITANEIAALTITANEIAANTITGAKIAALTIQAGEIAANAITADKINAGAITAVKIATDAIDATKISATAITSKHTITGALIQTSATANRGIKISSGGITAYNSSGVVVVDIDHTTGSALFTGTIRNRPSGARVEINSTDLRGHVWFYTGTSGSTPASIDSDPSGEGLLLYSGSLSGGVRRSSLQLYEQGANSVAGWYLGQMPTAGSSVTPMGFMTYDTDTSLGMVRTNAHAIVLSGVNGFIEMFGATTRVNGPLTVTGTKNFVMDHPSKPGMQLKHASSESPFNGVEYWSDGFMEIPAEGYLLVTLPDYFEALTADDHRIVTLTAGSEEANLWSTPIIDGQFEVHGAVGAKFTWLVKARRVKLDENGEDTLGFEVEAPVIEVCQVPSGPESAPANQQPPADAGAIMRPRTYPLWSA